MKEHIRYNVAGHSFLIGAEEADLRDIRLLLPSYSPFLVSGQSDVQPVFELWLTSVRQSLHGSQVYRFEWEGASYAIYQGEEGYDFEILPSGKSEPYLMCTDTEFTKASLCLDGKVKSDAFILNNCLMMMYAFATAPLMTLLVHASVTINSGKAYLFLGKSGTGKSTHSSLWLKYIPGSELLNDDNPVVRVVGEQVIVSGSPWSGKTPCYKNRQLPVGAVIKLNQAPENTIVKSKPSQAFATLLTSSSTMKWDKRIFDGICDTVTKAVEKIPFYTLDCLPDAGAAGLCHQTVTHG